MMSPFQGFRKGHCGRAGRDRGCGHDAQPVATLFMVAVRRARSGSGVFSTMGRWFYTTTDA